MVTEMIDFGKIERKWQRRWEKEKVFEVKEGKKKKWYVLEMYPYPSGSGLHMGHAFNYTIGDIQARMKRMQGYNVLYPMGYDSFGLPAENAAIKNKSHPKKYTEEAVKNFEKQQRSIGLSYDWTRKIMSHDPQYYKWDQWIFLKMFERGLAYKKKAPVNWCKKCRTVLANEQVKDGKCYLHEETEVEVKQLEQWFLKTTKYADELYEGIDKLDEWPELVKKSQKHWIGKSYGTEVDFEICDDSAGICRRWPVFTTRVDTLFGVTFLVVSAQHPELSTLVTDEQKKKVDAFLKKVRSTSEEDLVSLEKEGVFSGTYAKNPFNGKEIPIWIGNFVVADYGSGMVMADAHDQRDYEFAHKYGIDLKIVLEPITGVPQENPEHRESIVALVWDKKNNRYLSVNWGDKLGGNLFIGGGLGKGEDPIKCAKREIEEETGFYDLKLLGKSETIHHNYFAHSKNKARKIDAVGLFFELRSEKKKNVKLEKDEYGKFKVEWIKKSEAGKIVKDELHKYVFEKFVCNRAYTNYGVLVNSEGFDGLHSKEAIEHITNALEMKGLGRKKVAFRLKDWLISRQRFWGCPIPIVYCEKCGVRAVKEKDLPVRLPDEIKFDSKENPLKKYDKFLNTTCPKCGENAKRETDTMDTFIDSSWYFLRYCDAKNNKKLFDKKKVNYWMPIDQYVGGKEHSTGHLIYSRFFTKFLRDIGLVDVDEPAKRLFNQGMLHGPDGVKMSKSKGNVVLPEEVSSGVGMDAARMFLMSVASPDKDIDWSDKGAEGSLRFIIRTNEFIDKFKKIKKEIRMSKLQESKFNRIVRDYTSDLENFRYNLAVIKIREMLLVLEEGSSRKELHVFLTLLNPICPHMTEEWHSKIFSSHSFISLARWPKFNEKKIDEKLEENYKKMDKTIEDVNNILKIVREKGKKAGKVYVYVLPNEIEFFDSEKMSKKLDKKVFVFAVNDKNKYDPQGKSKKVKPGRPGIYVE